MLVRRIPNATGVADSGRISDKLVGTLRSPTFPLKQKRIYLRMAGKGTQARLVIDGFQRIRYPIYGGLEINLNSDEIRWYGMDVSKWAGHRAYIEFLDNSPGYILVDAVVFSDGDAPANPTGSPFLSETVRELTQDKVTSHLWEQRKTVEIQLPTPEFAMVMQDGTPEETTVYLRGNYRTPGQVAPRRFLSALGGDKQKTPLPGSGRLEIAEKMALPTNPLVSRVFVNRLWKHHFGEGIVRTPDDFGFMGQRPTHPELLDWLATTFHQQGGSLKKMHRLMLLSRAYRMASQGDAKAEAADPQNLLLHRMPLRRLEAEAIRDAILAVSGRLDTTMYGAGVPTYLTPFMQGRGRPKDSGPLDGAGRRSVYLAVRRNFLSPFFLAFDFPVPFNTIGKRTVSNVPTQALAMMNNPFVAEQANVWAKRVLAQAGTTEARIQAMYETAFGRLPDKSEASIAQRFVESQATRYGQEGEVRAWSDLAHVLYNAKEFLFLR